MELPDNYLMELSGAGLIAWLVSLTSSRTEAAGLAYLATYSDRELIRIGWYASPTRQELYSMGSAGAWVARQAYASTPIEKLTYEEIQNCLRTTGVSTGLGKVLNDRVTEARMARLNADLSAIVAPLAALQACIHASGTKLMVIETP